LLEGKELGAAVHALVSKGPSWVNRRVEHAELIDDKHVLRRVSIDYSLDGVFRVAGIGQADELPCIPLTLLRKRPLKRFSLRDEAGNPLPLWGREENSTVAADAVVSAAEALLDDQGIALAAEVEIVLRATVIAGDAATFQAEAQHTAVGHPATAAAWNVLTGNPAFARFVETLRTEFLLLTAMTPHEGTRRIVKFSYEEPLDLDLGMSWINLRKAELGWRPRRIRIHTPAASAGRTFHFEVAAPPDLQIVRATFDFEDVGGQPGPVPPGLTDGQLFEEDTERVHLYVPTVDPRLETSVVMQVRAQASELLRGAFLTSLLAALLLFGAGMRLDEFRSNTDVAAALLVLVPALLAVYIARPGEHALARSMLIGVRALVLVSAGTAILAAYLIAAGFKGDLLLDLWAADTAVALACVLLLLKSNRPRR
jgi:hypothetical protein